MVVGGLESLGGLLNWSPNRLGRGWIRSAFLSSCYRAVGKGPLAPHLFGKGAFDLLPHEPQQEPPGIPRREIHQPFGLGKPPAKRGPCHPTCQPGSRTEFLAPPNSGVSSKFLGARIYFQCVWGGGVSMQLGKEAG